MFRRLKSCLGLLIGLVLLLGVAYAGWRWGSSVFPQLEGVFERVVADSAAAPLPPTQELADAALGNIERLRAGESESTEFALTGRDVTSLLRYGIPGLVPDGVSEPTVEFDEDGVSLRAKVEVQAFPQIPPIDDVLRLLSDTASIHMTGSLTPMDPGRVLLLIDDVQAARVPLPESVIPAILTALGRRPGDGIPAQAMALPLPAGLRSAFVRGDRLILVADRPLP